MERIKFRLKSYPASLLVRIVWLKLHNIMALSSTFHIYHIFLGESLVAKAWIAWDLLHIQIS